MLKRKIFELLNENTLDDGRQRQRAHDPSAVLHGKGIPCIQRTAGNSQNGMGGTLEALQAALTGLAVSNVDSTWREGVATAEIVASHIIDNSSVPNWHGNVDVHGFVHFIQQTAHSRSFSRSKFVSRIYHHNRTRHTVPVLLGWGLHSSGLAPFDSYLLQPPDCLAQAWAHAVTQTQAMPGHSGKAENPGRQYVLADATDYLLRICVGGDHHSAHLSRNAFATINAMRVRSEGDTDRATVLVHMLTVAFTFTDDRAKVWRSNFQRSTLKQILTLPTRAGASVINFVEEQSGAGEAPIVNKTLEMLVQDMTLESLVDVLTFLLSECESLSDVHWVFVRTSLRWTIGREGRGAKCDPRLPAFVGLAKEVCVRAAKDGRAVGFAAAIRFVQCLLIYMTPTDYKSFFTQLFGRVGKNVTAQTTSIEPTKRAFLTFMQAMELLVPSDHLEILRLNKQAVLPFRKDHHRSLVCDYLGLLNTRIDDLERFSREDAGESSSSKQERKDALAKEIVAYVDAFHATQAVPKALNQTIVFRKQFFLKMFVPVLLSPSQVFLHDDNLDYDFHKERRRLISVLAEKSIIPSSVYSKFLASDCSQRSQKSLSQRSTSSKSILAKLPAFAVSMVQAAQAAALPTGEGGENKLVARKVVKSWRDYLEQVAKYMAENRGEGEFAKDLIDAVGKSIVVVFNTGYDFGLCKKWVSDFLQVAHQSECTIPVTNELEAFIDRYLDSSCPPTMLLTVGMLMAHLARTARDDWQEKMLLKCVSRLFHAPPEASLCDAVRELYEYFLLTVVFHFDRSWVCSGGKKEGRDFMINPNILKLCSWLDQSLLESDSVLATVLSEVEANGIGNMVAVTLSDALALEICLSSRRPASKIFASCNPPISQVDNAFVDTLKTIFFRCLVLEQDTHETHCVGLLMELADDDGTRTGSMFVAAIEEFMQEMLGDRPFHSWFLKALFKDSRVQDSKIVQTMTSVRLLKAALCQVSMALIKSLPGNVLFGRSHLFGEYAKDFMAVFHEFHDRVIE